MTRVQTQLFAEVDFEDGDAPICVCVVDAIEMYLQSKGIDTVVDQQRVYSSGLRWRGSLSITSCLASDLRTVPRHRLHFRPLRRS
jgi:hypothetical protein